jgi:hypothetical protein
MDQQSLRTVEKILGCDFELSNALQRPGDSSGHVYEASRLLLSEIRGFPKDASTRGTALEYGRRFLSSCGSSWYVDSDHLEGNLPEHRSAFQHPVILHGAGFAEARAAQLAATASLRRDTKLNVVANCSDGNTSWGSHLNVLITRQCFHDLLQRKPHLAVFFATHLVTSVLYTGQGLVGSANEQAACHFQLSQRADWFVEFAGLDTMKSRALINTRDEHLAESRLARLHIIYYDQVLSPIANILKAGTTHLVLPMI